VNAGEDKDEIGNEAARIQESAMYSAQTQFSSSKFWRTANYVLGVPAAALAAIAGATGLADAADAQTAATIALIAAALTAILTTLNAAQRAEQSRVVATAYQALQGDARVFRTIDLPKLSYDDARVRLDELIAHRNTINDTAPVPAYIAYQLGKRNITKGRQDYRVDNN
jgi:hypothetical protein